MKIYIIPYAFGTSYSLETLKQGLKCIFKNTIEIVCMDMPGHGKQIMEPLEYSIKKIAAIMGNRLLKTQDFNEPYYILGISMGAIVATEICHYLNLFEVNLPRRMLITCSFSPFKKVTYKAYEQFTLVDIREELSTHVHVPKELLDNIDFLNFLKPIVMADLIALRDYQYNYLNTLLGCPISLIVGYKNYEKDKKDFKNWHLVSSDVENLKIICGEHLFFMESEKQLNVFVKEIKKAINV